MFLLTNEILKEFSFKQRQTSRYSSYLTPYLEDVYLLLSRSIISYTNANRRNAIVDSIADNLAIIRLARLEDLVAILML
ncbi:hypothetical protein D0862_15013 [Hortaea werneckii]|uniref:Uncharacterized protein n=1 Tax=Hortaea werneckii TaxID=91943 RepID=A0A3M7DVE6_HORWE|nr:hypothetical protein D0862_15013 [Hortaea werneckii]